MGLEEQGRRGQRSSGLPNGVRPRLVAPAHRVRRTGHAHALGRAPVVVVAVAVADLCGVR